MKEIESVLQSHPNLSLDDYLVSSKMAFDKVCGTDIEILAATSLFSTNIYI